MNSSVEIYKQKYLKYKMKYLLLQSGGTYSDTWKKEEEAERKQKREAAEKQRAAKENVEIKRFNESLNNIEQMSNNAKNKIFPNNITGEEIKYLCDFMPEHNFNIEKKDCNEIFTRNNLFDKLFTNTDINELLKKLKVKIYDSDTKLDKLNKLKQYIYANLNDELKKKYKNSNKN